MPHRPMLELDNQTTLAVGVYPGWNPDRQFQYTLVCKAGYRFDLDGRVTPLDSPALIVEADTLRGEHGRGSVEAALETVPFKRGADVYFFGTAHPPPGGARVMEVGLAVFRRGVQQVRKVLRVFGRRRWRRTVGGYVPTDPEPLGPTPVVYENAFGGQANDDPASAHPCNPVGKGFNADYFHVSNLDLPLIEQGPRFIRSPTDKPRPAGLGPLPVTWEPRRSQWGTPVEEPTDDAGVPVCPWGTDAEPELHNCAPPDQRLGAPLEGGEEVQLAGFFPDRAPRDVVRFTVPATAIDAWAIAGGRRRKLKLICDTLVIDADKMEFYVIGRAAISWRIDAPRVGRVLIRPERNVGQGEGPVQNVVEMDFPS